VGWRQRSQPERGRKRWEMRKRAKEKVQPDDEKVFESSKPYFVFSFQMILSEP
jgi:hypothetical protein